MNYFKLKIFTVLSIALVILSCEKDDICAEATATTPQLIVRFYDTNSTEETKAVSDLLVYGVNDANEAVFFQNVSFATSDSVVVPLRTDSNISRLVFHKDLTITDFETGNLDIIGFDYTNDNIYVSRACGYKNVYNDLGATLEADLNNWIINIEIEENTSVDNQNSAHVKIYH